MSSKPQFYDSKDKASIIRYAHNLVNYTLREACAGIVEDKGVQSGKGRFGNFLEKYYFQYRINNVSKPDFEEAGLELKSSPLLPGQPPAKPKAKERLVLGMIDYWGIVHEEFETSQFWAKNKDLLLVFYLHQDDTEAWDLVVKYADEWIFPAEDRKIVRDDWTYIRDKVRKGKAIELSEGDTNYLGACTKGAKGTDRRAQPKAAELAKPRAFSIKQNYVTTTILQEFVRRALAEKGRTLSKFNMSTIIDKEFIRSGATFEEYVLEKFRPYYDLSIERIADALNIKCQRNAKSYYSVVCKEVVKKILGVSNLDILEFKKSDITIKTMRVDKRYRPREAMSFPAIDYPSLEIESEWEDSEFYEMLQKRYLLIVVQQDNEASDVILRRAFFWRVPTLDQWKIEKVWNRTRQQVLKHEYENFPRESEGMLAHVRPHGRDSNDYAKTSDGIRTVKKSFWLNKDYLQSVILENMDLL